MFDPTSYASLVSQLTTLETQYKMLKNNITHFSLKQQWQTTLHTLENANVANMFGETAGIKIVLNSNSPSTSSTAWKTATISMNSGTSSYLQGQSLGSSRMSQLAMIETADSISPDCLTAVGQYRNNRTENATANSTLLSDQFDSTDGTNTEVQQLNLLNAAEAQKLTEMQAQGTLHTCLAGQMTVRLIGGRKNGIIAGGTGSGKTTLMKALLDHVPMQERLIVIEQPAELKIAHPNAVRWEAVAAIPGQVAVTPSQLVAAALRHRPDRIIMGEIRDECGYDLLQAMNTGHGGTLSTLHAVRRDRPLLLLAAALALPRIAAAAHAQPLRCANAQGS